MNFNKKYTFLFFLILCFMGFDCKKECTKVDWSGSYLGRDFISKTSGTSTIAEPSIDVKAEISWNSNQLIGNNILLKVTLLYNANNPIILTLYGDANCSESFTFRDKGDYRPALIDNNGNKYTLEYKGSSGSYLNNSKDVQIKITEVKVYDLEAFKTQNYTATHLLKLNKQ